MAPHGATISRASSPSCSTRGLPAPLSATTTSAHGASLATRTLSVLPGSARADRAHAATSCATSSAGVPGVPRAGGVLPEIDQQLEPCGLSPVILELRGSAARGPLRPPPR